MLVVKTGMSSERDLARRMAAQDVVVLTGIVTVAQLKAAVPRQCTSIISVGLCGGLAPEARVGDVFICGDLFTPDGVYMADAPWRQRLWAKGHFHEQRWWSSGQFNTANSVEQRAELFKKTGCWVIDDETFAVAEFAKLKGIPFQALRAVSDGTESDLPKAVTTALNPDGTPNFRALFGSLFTGHLQQDAQQIGQLDRVAVEYEQSMAALADALRLIGPYFQWQ